MSLLTEQLKKVPASTSAVDPDAPGVVLMVGKYCSDAAKAIERQSARIHELDSMVIAANKVTIERGGVIVSQTDKLIDLTIKNNELEVQIVALRDALVLCRPEVAPKGGDAWVATVAALGIAQ